MRCSFPNTVPDPYFNRRSEAAGSLVPVSPHVNKTGRGKSPLAADSECGGASSSAESTEQRSGTGDWTGGAYTRAARAGDCVVPRAPCAVRGCGEVAHSARPHRNCNGRIGGGVRASEVAIGAQPCALAWCYNGLGTGDADMRIWYIDAVARRAGCGCYDA